MRTSEFYWDLGESQHRMGAWKGQSKLCEDFHSSSWSNAPVGHFSLRLLVFCFKHDRRFIRWALVQISFQEADAAPAWITCLWPHRARAVRVICEHGRRGVLLSKSRGRCHFSWDKRRKAGKVRGTEDEIKGGRRGKRDEMKDEEKRADCQAEQHDNHKTCFL